MCAAFFYNLQARLMESKPIPQEATRGQRETQKRRKGREQFFVLQSTQSFAILPKNKLFTTRFHPSRQNEKREVLKLTPIKRVVCQYSLLLDLAFLLLLFHFPPSSFALHPSTTPSHNPRNPRHSPPPYFTSLTCLKTLQKGPIHNNFVVSRR